MVGHYKVHLLFFPDDKLRLIAQNVNFWEGARSSNDPHAAAGDATGASHASANGRREKD
jgi:hypothetical protein